MQHRSHNKILKSSEFSLIQNEPRSADVIYAKQSRIIVNTVVFLIISMTLGGYIFGLTDMISASMLDKEVPQSFHPIIFGIFMIACLSAAAVIGSHHLIKESFCPDSAQNEINDLFSKTPDLEWFRIRINAQKRTLTYGELEEIKAYLTRKTNVSPILKILNM